MTEGQIGAVAEPTDSLTPSAAAEAVPDRVTSVRFFSGNWHRLATLALAEAATVALACLAAMRLQSPGDFAESSMAGAPPWVLAVIASAVTLAGLSSMGLYQLRQRARFTGVLARLVVGLLIAMAGLSLVVALSAPMSASPGVLFATGILSFGGLAVLRYGFMRLVDQEFFKRRVLVWGAGNRASLIANRLRRRTDQRGFRIVGYVAAPGDEVAVSHANLVQREGDLLRFALNQQVEEIVVAMDDRRQGFPEAWLRECRLRGIAVRDIVTFLERETGRVSVEIAPPSWLIYSEGFRCDVVRLAIKRAFDVVASLAVLAVAWPLAVLAAIAIFLEDRGPVLYRQVRTGQNGKPFHIVKFRSMRVNAEANGKAVWAGKNDSRVTRVGEFIRKVRIDEIPQLWNVLVGDMSFVGPRPERPEFVESLARTIPFYNERHFVKPGITGWAQVRYPYGSSENDAREKLGYDLYYVTNHGIVFDIMVLLQTVEVVLFRIGSR